VSKVAGVLLQKTETFASLGQFHLTFITALKSLN
jgi:hypothetical protein